MCSDSYLGEASAEFEEFLNWMGTKVDLAGWPSYAGELDTRDNRHGQYSIFATFKDTEIMFHVSTYIPHGENGSIQESLRKKILGHDLVTLVYLEGMNDTFHPPCLTSESPQAFGVVRPAGKTADGKEQFRLAFAARSGVPQFGPPVPCPAVFTKDQYFHDFLLTKRA